MRNARGVEGCMMRAHNQSRRIDPSRGLRRTCRRISIPSAIWLAHFLPYRHRFTHNKTDKGNSRSVFKRKAATIRVSLGMDAHSGGREVIGLLMQETPGQNERTPKNMMRTLPVGHQRKVVAKQERRRALRHNHKRASCSGNTHDITYASQNGGL